VKELNNMQELDITTLSPETAEEASAILREAWENNTTVNIRGGGTKQDLGNIGKPTYLTLSTLKLDKLVAYEPADLTITVQAGMKWATLREIMAEKGQWLPLDPPELEGATVGGVVASNVSGPKRLLYGTLRDLVIGCQFVLADGTIGRSGGRVVKNVSGYDLHKLLIGSLGTLTLITELTFKVLPKPQISRWFNMRFETVAIGLETSRKLARSNFSPAALELIGIDNGACGLRVAVDGQEVAVVRQMDEIMALCRQQGAKDISILDPANKYPEDVAIIVEVMGSLGLQRAIAYNILFRFSSHLTDMLFSWQLAEKILRQLDDVSLTLQARAGTGLIYLYPRAYKDENILEAIPLIQDAREKLEAKGGSLVIEKAPLALKEKLEVWGKPAGLNSLSAMQTIKRQLDERNLLNPGKFVGGI